jgi:hypothetical protein
METNISRLVLVLCICSRLVIGQSMINPLDIPAPSKDMPSWAKLLYVTPLNVHQVKD